jgi:hypothetical protein
MLLSANPSLTPGQVKTLLRDTADPIGDPDKTGAGRVNAYAAVQAALSGSTPTPTVPPPTVTPTPPTETPVPPTETPVPPTETPGGPTATPTRTPVPPTATPGGPTATPESPTATPVPPTITPAPEPTYVESIAEIKLNGATFPRMSGFEAVFFLYQSITRRFTIYAVIQMPDGTMIDIRTFGTRILPLAVDMGGLPADPVFMYSMLAMEVPVGAPLGNYIIMAGFFDPTIRITGPQDAFLLVQTPFSIT